MQNTIAPRQSGASGAKKKEDRGGKQKPFLGKRGGGPDTERKRPDGKKPSKGLSAQGHPAKKEKTPTGRG